MLTFSEDWELDGGCILLIDLVDAVDWVHLDVGADIVVVAGNFAVAVAMVAAGSLVPKKMHADVVAGHNTALNI